VTSITDKAFDTLLSTFEREAIHLEMRDAYGTTVELPHMARWAAGEPDDLQWLEGWCQVLRRHVAAGRGVRRARIVSEPFSDYQRWSYSIAHAMVAAGEDIRWVPRRLVSSVGLPGNDFYLFDDRLVVFLLYSGPRKCCGRIAYISRCRRCAGQAMERSKPPSVVIGS
jgi:hypothetical protein